MSSSPVAVRQKWLLPLPVTPIMAMRIPPSPDPGRTLEGSGRISDGSVLANIGVGLGIGLTLVLLDPDGIRGGSALVGFALGLWSIENLALVDSRSVW